MSLTGAPFVSLLGVLAVGGFVALVVLWPALSGRSPRALAGRAGLLLTVNLLVLVAVAGQVNAHYLFFADWKDLHQALSGAAVATAETHLGAARAPLARSERRQVAAAGGQLRRYVVTGAESGIRATVDVLLPHDYAKGTARYPVLETFGGYPSTPMQFIGTMHLGSALAHAARADQLQVPLVVSPEVEVPGGVDTECVNGRPGLPQLETWLTHDVPAWVMRTFRVQPDRRSWAAIGLSAGGWCAAMATLLHPQRYAAAIVLAGYFSPEFGRYHPYAGASPLARRYDLVRLVQRVPPDVDLWLETSKADRVSYGSSSALLRVVRAPLSVTALVLEHAGHRMGVWRGLLPRALTWLATTVPGFAAPPVAAPVRAAR